MHACVCVCRGHHAFHCLNVITDSLRMLLLLLFVEDAIVFTAILRKPHVYKHKHISTNRHEHIKTHTYSMKVSN